MGPFGHFAMALAARPWAPRISFFVLFTAAMSLDLLYMAVALAGGRDPTSWSHGLFMSAVWSVVVALVAGWFYRSPRAGIVLGSVVLSHWVLDWISHPIPFSSFSWRTWRWDYGHEVPPDLPLFFGNSPRVALGLYNSISATAATALEAGMFVLAAGIYVRFRARRKKPSKLNSP